MTFLWRSSTFIKTMSLMKYIILYMCNVDKKVKVHVDKIERNMSNEQKNLSYLDSALVLNNFKTFLTNVLALVSSLMSFGRLLNNLETES